jgi:two-component system, LytTR family, sensor histidine kinase AlgZ
MQPKTLYWVCQIAGWSCFTLYVLTGYVAAVGIPHIQVSAIVTILVFDAGVCPLVSHQIRLWMRRRGWIALPFRTLTPRLTGVAFLVGAGLTMLVMLVEVLIHGYQDLDTSTLVGMFFGFSWGMAGWLLIYCAVIARRRHVALERQALALTLVARDAQLRALRSQLNPHFLFNCLNNLRGLIAEDPAKAVSMVTGLAGLLRYSLRSDRAATIALAEEMEAVHDYLSLERVRFEERLHVQCTMSPTALAARIPPMLVQTLVENAITHGIAELPAGGVVRIDARVVDGHLKIQVANSGRLRASVAGTGVGLENAREQLRLLYGDAASLALRERGGDMVVASVMIPARESTP